MQNHARQNVYLPPPDPKERIRQLIAEQKGGLEWETQQAIYQAAGVVQGDDMERTHPLQNWGGTTYVVPLEVDQLGKIKVRLDQWKSGYEALSLLLFLVAPCDHLNIESVVASIRVSLDPSFRGYDALFKHKIFEVLPSFSRCLARWETFAAILQHLQQQHPNHLYLHKVFDDILPREWEATSDRSDSASLEVSDFSKRRWIVLLALLLVTSKDDLAGSEYPHPLTFALGAFKGRVDHTHSSDPRYRSGFQVMSRHEG
ncbi:uncharacterized protein JCM6883_000348 [Sporobolomyces salmoneus]|uniref:uncharacterized protein n=1 Tax=Sporobolomyces salmoneus TaxID=183962 RepID=UPI003177D45D